MFRNEYPLLIAKAKDPADYKWENIDTSV